MIIMTPVTKLQAAFWPKLQEFRTGKRSRRASKNSSLHQPLSPCRATLALTMINDCANPVTWTKEATHWSAPPYSCCDWGIYTQLLFADKLLLLPRTCPKSIRLTQSSLSLVNGMTAAISTGSAASSSEVYTCIPAVRSKGHLHYIGDRNRRDFTVAVQICGPA